MNVKDLDTAQMPADALEQARAMIGMPITFEQYNYEATRDTIRHYAYGLGDDNPLFSDPEYVKQTRWRSIIAPPCFYFGVIDCAVNPGLPEIQWYMAESTWRFFRPLYRNDEIHLQARYLDAKEAKGQTASRIIFQTGDVTFTNQRGEKTAHLLTTVARVARAGTEAGLTYGERPAHRYTAEEIAAIRNAMINEYRRGSDTLYWEDVTVGEDLPGTVRGPITQLDMTVYYQGAAGTAGYKSTKMKAIYQLWARHSPEKLPNNFHPCYYGSDVSPSIGHQNPQVAVNDLGMPGPYDNGGQRTGMMATVLTNWMGDDGFVREYTARIRRPVVFGDTSYFKGKVIGKRKEGDVGLVEVSLEGRNQLNELTTSGSGVIELPLRHNP